MQGSSGRPGRRGFMKPPKNCRPLSNALLSLPLALVLLCAAPTPALALGDWIGAEGSYWHQSQDGSASIDGSILNGTTFDFHDTLGLDKTDNTTLRPVWLRGSTPRRVCAYCP